MIFYMVHIDPRNGVEATSTSEPNLNFPLPGEKGPACLVKVSTANLIYIYCNTQTLKIWKILGCSSFFQRTPKAECQICNGQLKCSEK